MFLLILYQQKVYFPVGNYYSSDKKKHLLKVVHKSVIARISLNI